jgi:xylulose-5-phosphate/fructose-6-phosphate phosphoketolase
LLSSWLSSYKPSELFEENGSPIDEIVEVVIPRDKKKRLGRRKEANADYFPLDVPEWSKGAVEKLTQQSCMKIVGDFLAEVIARYVL